MGNRTGLGVTFDAYDMEAKLGNLAKKLKERGGTAIVISTALNEAIDAAQTEANKAIREEFVAPEAEVRKTLKVWKADRRRLQATLRARGKASLELIHYKPIDPNVRFQKKKAKWLAENELQEKKRKRPQNTGMGVTVKVLKSSGRKVIKPGGKTKILATKKGASATFVAKGRKDQKYHVLARIEGHKDPIMLWGPSFLSRLSNKDIRARILQAGVNKIEKRLKGIANAFLRDETKFTSKKRWAQK